MKESQLREMIRVCLLDFNKNPKTPAPVLKRPEIEPAPPKPTVLPMPPQESSTIPQKTNEKGGYTKWL